MKTTNQEYIDVLAEELDREKLVIFIGAGVSIGSNLPSWNELIKKLDPKYIITTNYDILIEEKLNEVYSYDVIIKEEDLAYSQSNKMIIKMHGDLKNKNIVLKKSDYDNYEKERPLITTFVKSLFTTNTVLFIGYSLNDLNVKGIMNWISEILKNDFRRAYLADVSEPNPLNKYQNEQNKLVNRIFLGNDFEKTKGELVADFLEKIIITKEEINENVKGRFYKNLNYITDNQFKKIIGDPMAQVEEFKNDKASSTLKKRFVLKKLDEINDENIMLAVKSNIIKIEKKL